MVIKKKRETTIEDLAIMINKGFNELKESNAREHKEMTQSNAREHEDIRMRLDNVAYRFELNALEKRVERLEKIDLINTSKLPK